MCKRVSRKTPSSGSEVSKEWSTLTKHCHWKQESKETRKYSDKRITVVGCMVGGGVRGGRNIIEHSGVNLGVSVKEVK
jgi:hypothetical protein